MTTQPNIVLIVADDMGYGDFGLYSEGRVHTPALDALASNSLRLTQQYAGSPACSPSRAALFTGRYPHRTGAITPQETLGNDRIALNEATIADSLRAAGYATGLVHKSLQGRPNHKCAHTDDGQRHKNGHFMLLNPPAHIECSPVFYTPMGLLFGHFSRSLNDNRTG